MQQRHGVRGGLRLAASLRWLCLLTMLAPGVHAEEVALPAALQVTLFVRILSFDRGLAARAADGIVIGIVHQGKFRQSLNEREAIAAALSERDSISIAGRRVQVTTIPIDIDVVDLAPTLAKEHVDLLYVAPLRAVDIASIAAVSESAHVPSLTGVPAYVRAGLAIGLDVKKERPEIVINLAAARAAGADFNSQLLQLATIVR